LYKKTTLPNGLRVLTSDIPYARSVSAAFFVAAGSRHEQAEKAGVAHFLEHMFFKGTQSRPTSQEISEAIEGVGGIINAEVGKEMAVYWAKVAQQHTGVALDILTDVLRNSLFDTDEIEKERRVILEELNMIADDPREWVDVILDEVMWGDQALGRDVGGTKETVSGISREDILNYLATRYSPRSTVISIAGALEHERIVDDLASRLGDWQGPPASPPPGVVIDQTAPRLRLQEKDTEQSHVSLGLRAISYLDPERYALDLLNVVLGEGMSSRLFLEIREKRGLAYDVHSYINHYQDTGAMVAYAGVEPAKVEQTVAALMEQISRMREPTPSQELSKAKEFWKGRMILRLEDTRGIASWVGSQEMLLDQVLTVDEVIDIIDRITAEDVQRAADRIFADERLSLAVVGPVDAGNQLVDLLHFDK
jgi:predicted Zn-dependent peptidase